MDALFEDVSVRGASNGVEQHPDVEMVGAVPKRAPHEPDVTFPEGAQSSASILEKDCVETVDLAATNADGNDANAEAGMIKKFCHDSYTAVEIVTQVS